ncbi:MAG: DoxX family protein [Gemmatimonadales bacterium]|nr:DoxX family protein [Gemmatimonadales bacterium]
MTRIQLARAAFALMFVLAGSLHFAAPAYYRSVMPPFLPAPAALVAVTGAAEIAGGLGLLIPSLRPAAGIGLMLLLVAVLPANVEMLRQARAQGASPMVEGLLWLRLPFQLVLIWLAWRLSRKDRADHAG